MTEPIIPNAAALTGWRKSAHSGSEGGSCLEVLDNHPAGVPIRVDPEVPEETRLTLQARGVDFGSVLQAVGKQANLKIGREDGAIVLATWPMLAVNDERRTIQEPMAPWGNEWQGLPGFALPGEIRRRGERLHLNIARQSNGDHVFLQPLAHADAGIEPPGNDVAQAVVDHDVEDDVGTRAVKPCQGR